jgi:hypothetical protein
MKSGIKWAIEKSDYFGQPVSLNFDKEKKFKTTLGGLLSLIIYGVAISVIIISGWSLIARLNPKTTYTKKNLGTAPITNLKEQNVLLMAYFQPDGAGYDKFYDPTYIDLKFNLFTSKRYDNGTQIAGKITLNSTNCTNYYSNFENQGLGKYFTSNNLHLASCLDFENDITIGGKFDSEFYSNIYLTLDSCKNRTGSTIICKPYEEIFNKLYDGYLTLVFFDKYVDVNNFTDPFVNYVNTFFQKVDPQLYKKIDMYFEIANVTSDVGFLFEDKRTNSSIMLEKYNQDVIHISQSKKIMAYYINMSENTSLYTRNYMKFQELAALFGGIFQAMIIVGYVLTYFTSQFKMYEIMFNKLFIQKADTIHKNHQYISTNEEIKKLKTFLEEKHSYVFKQTTKDEKLSQYAPVVNKKNFFSDKSVYLSNGTYSNKEFIKKQIDYKIKDYHDKIYKKFRYNLRDILSMFICGLCNKKSRDKKKIFDVGFMKLLKYLDFLEIIKTLQQFHQLKDILLTNNQSKLFEYFNKPEMSEESEKIEKNPDFSYMDLYNCYIKASSKTNNKMNKRLVENFDLRLKEIFKIFEDKGNGNPNLEKDKYIS